MSEPHPALSRHLNARELTRVPNGGQVVDGWGIIWTANDIGAGIIGHLDIEPVPGLSDNTLVEICGPITLRPAMDWDINQQAMGGEA